MSKFKPGESGNKKGRPQGAKNRTSEQLREALKSFIDLNFDNIQNTYEGLEPKEKLKFFNDVLKFVLSPPVNPERLTDEQLRQIIEYLKNNQQDEKNQKDN